jgi:hypothetical protein
MTRTLLAVAFALVALPSPAADPVKPTGNWKFRFVERQTVTFLLAFAEEDGKWVGDFIGSDPQLQFKAPPKVSNVQVKGEVVKFGVQIDGEEAFNVEGVLAKDGKKISGSVSKFGGPLEVTDLYPSKLKKLTDPVELAREDFAQLDGGQPLFDAGFVVAKAAAEKKLTADDARGIADRLTKAAAGYGPRWEMDVAVKLADAFAAQDGFAEVALAQARRAERMLADDAPVSAQMDVTGVVERALVKAGKADEAKKYAATLVKLEARDAADYAKSTLTFDTPEFKGRKAKGDRVALVELFTGAECPPCVAMDVAFDGLVKTYKSADVVLLQYHIHVPGPDPLTSEAGMERGVTLFGERLSAPTALVNGKPVSRGGGDMKAAAKKYKDLCEAIDEQLEKPAAVKLALSVAKADKGLTATAKVTDLAKPGDKVALRFAVTEERVRYPGGNGVRFHHHVVRAMPGGAKGFPLAKKDHEQAVAVNVEDIRGGLTKYLDAFAKEQAEFPRPDRPLALKNLKLVAFVQDDASGEVLNAVQVELDK